jgi:hypothetical protein
LAGGAATTTTTNNYAASTAESFLLTHDLNLPDNITFDYGAEEEELREDEFETMDDKELAALDIDNIVVSQRPTDYEAPYHYAFGNCQGAGDHGGRVPLQTIIQQTSPSDCDFGGKGGGGSPLKKKRRLRQVSNEPDEDIISKFPIFVKNEWYIERPYHVIDDPDVAKAVQDSKSCSHVPPEDWQDSTKYNPITQKIFTSWIPVHNILLEKKDKALCTLFVNPPVLPWYAAEHPSGYCAFIMNFLTTRSTSYYKNGGHNANYIRSNGQMTESCWQLPRLSLGDEIFLKSLRCDLWPFAYNHKNQEGKPEDIFCPDDLAEIMVHVSKFIETVIHLTAKTNIMSVATLAYIKNYVGTKKIDSFFQSGKLFSLSTKECKPSCHAECFTNELYKKNVLAPQQAKGWDTMYTNIKAFHGIDTLCTAAASCLNVVEGSAEHVLLVEKEKANWAKNAVEQTAKFAKGEGNFQLAAMKELKERGIKCKDPTKAKSILNSINNPMKNPKTAAKKAASQIGALNARYKGDKWSPGEVIQLCELCKAQHNMTKIVEIMNCDVASKRTVHNKIIELGIRVIFKGKYQLLTKKY